MFVAHHMPRFILKSCQRIKLNTMNKVIYFLVTLWVAVSITGCSKHLDKSTVKESLVGTWQWVRTDGGFAFHIHETPSTTGKTIHLKITSDGKYSIYSNGALTSNGTYTLETRQCIHDHTNKTFVNFSSDPDFMVETIDNHNLEVSDEAYDGVGSSYKRKS
jgi:hypothetical protein